MRFLASILVMALAVMALCAIPDESDAKVVAKGKVVVRGRSRGVGVGGGFVGVGVGHGGFVRGNNVNDFQFNTFATGLGGRTVIVERPFAFLPPPTIVTSSTTTTTASRNNAAFLAQSDLVDPLLLQQQELLLRQRGGGGLVGGPFGNVNVRFGRGVENFRFR